MLGYLLRSATKSKLEKALSQHFSGVDFARIATASREFPITSRVDVQSSLEQFFSNRPETELFGIHLQMGHETPTMAHLFSRGAYQPADFGPLQHDEIDIGEDSPARCLKNGLWLSREGSLPFAALFGPKVSYGEVGGIHLEISVPAGDEGAAFSERWFSEIESLVAAGSTYRGRVLSLEGQQHYSGQGGAVKVHRLRQVAREDVILPEKTLALLDRNVRDFVAARDRIRALRFSTKKGLLFYGPPGTGKTHTIHYLASQLPEHTTLLITAEQVAFLGEYFRLARFLQPAMMVIEDVDLIARNREDMNGPCEEALLNKLLNEMDGLREDTDILFVLTTNRPDQLEFALASRPGRIDQAIEFPLPDQGGRAKLVKLYARGVEVPEALLSSIVRRTEGASAAFIKELMRRSAQFQMEANDGAVLEPAAVDGAIQEMVFSGGALNLKLLGGSTQNLADTA